MNNVIMRKIDLDGSVQAITDRDREVFSVEISTPPINADPVYFQVESDGEVPWLPGEYHALRRVNLATIRVRGTPGDMVTLIGGTW
jgi:hypothetical protein